MNGRTAVSFAAELVPWGSVIILENSVLLDLIWLEAAPFSMAGVVCSNNTRRFHRDQIQFLCGRRVYTVASSVSA